MTVQKLYAKNIYKGNGSNKSFPFTFECPENHPEFVRVFVRENHLTETTNFAIDMQNRIVTYPVDGDALPEGANIIITRELPLIQVMNLINNGPFFAEDIETSLDEIVMMVQQLNEKADRSLTVEVDSTENPNDVIGQIFDARTLTQKLAEESAAAAAASLQSEQNAKASETASLQNKVATDENRSSVEQSKSQVDKLLSQVISHEETVLGYMNNSADSANQAEAYEESSRVNAITASNAASYAGTKASEASASQTAANESAVGAREQADRAAQEADRVAELAAGTVPLPVGTILPYASNGDIPVGFLSCNGASVSKITYPSLFEVIGYTYGGSGDYFNLPNLNDNRFIEGSDEAGTYKEAGVPNIEGRFGIRRISSSKALTTSLNGALYKGDDLGSGFTYVNEGSGASACEGIYLDASRSSSVYGNAETVQPKSLTIRYIIKAFAGASPSSTDLEITNVANDLAILSANAEQLNTIVYRDSQGYVRYESGLQICWGQPSGISGEVNSYTFEVPFVSEPTVVLCGLNSTNQDSATIALTRIATNRGASATQFKWHVASPTTVTGTICKFVAFGRWK